MRTRILLTTLVSAILCVGCGSAAAPQPTSMGPVQAWPAGVADVTAAPPAPEAECDEEASLRPSALPAPAAMPAGSTMAAIADRGRLVVGVDQNQYHFGFRDPATGRLEGFDVDVAREIARAIFGDPEQIQFRVVDAGQREAVLKSGEVDLVIRTFSITCERKRNVAFSSVYFYSDQRILVPKDSGITSADQMAGKTACAVSGTTSLAYLYRLNPDAKVLSAPTWTDCLLMLQQGQVDVIGTDHVVLSGLQAQDPDVEVVGPSLGVEPYGIGVKQENTDLVRFVNAVLERMRTDGTWQRLYDQSLLSMGPSPGPPAARYQD